MATPGGAPGVWRALSGGLGLVGVVTELVLQLTPPTNTQLKTVLSQPDTHMLDTVSQLLEVGSRSRARAHARAPSYRFL